jgi:membrane protein YdbS with pleckstrin-like domain
MDKKAQMAEIKKQVAAMMATAFALVAALFWNDAIKSLVNSYIPAQSAWPYMMVTAVIVTVIAVLAIFMISKTLGAQK